MSFGRMAQKFMRNSRRVPIRISISSPVNSIESFIDSLKIKPPIVEAKLTLVSNLHYMKSTELSCLYITRAFCSDLIRYILNK